MPERHNDQNDQNTRTDRHRRGGTWWTAIAVVALAAALIVNVVVIDASQVGFLIPIFVAVAIALSYENRGSICGRRHAK